METKTLQFYKDLSKQRRAELWLIVAVAALGIVATGFVINALGKQNSTVVSNERLHEQNQSLIEANKGLTDTVNELAEGMKKRNDRDSASAVLIKKNNELLPQIESKLSTINRKYENSSKPLNFTDSELESYVSTEADRLRKEGFR